MVFVPDAPISLQNDPTTTSDSVVRFTWTEGPSNGDRTVIDYRVIYDQSTGDFVTLAEGVLTTYYETSISLIKGQIYTFKVQARNTVGYSVESNELGVLVAQVPDKPEAPTTTIDGDTVRIDWIIPYDGSSPITGYIIIVQHNDGVTYTEETTHCNGLEIAIIDNHSCNVLISDLIQAPYHRDWGASIYAKVIAINIIGNSQVSEAGNGAIILTVPEAPTDLANVPAITLANQVGLTWNEGPTNGGSPVIDYKLIYGEATGSYN